MEHSIVLPDKPEPDKVNVTDVFKEHSSSLSIADNRGSDEVDARAYVIFGEQSTSPSDVTDAPLLRQLPPKGSESYSIQRCEALIFYNDELNEDEQNVKLQKTLVDTGFNVKPYTNPTKGEISKALDEAKSFETDCVLVVVMTRKISGRVVKAKDGNYNVHDLWLPLHGKRCPNLAGCPKIIIVIAKEEKDFPDGPNAFQAGDLTDCNPRPYRIPITSDILVVLGSKLNESISAVTNAIQSSLVGNSNDLLQNLTSPYLSLVSTLTRKIFFSVDSGTIIKNPSNYRIISISGKKTLAVIFLHKTFDNPNVYPRSGADQDLERLTDTFTKLHFVIHEPFVNKTKTEIKTSMKWVTEQIDNYDCVVICVLTHGEKGYLHARDTYYKTEKLFIQLLEKAHLGKPVLFFIQACQGDVFELGLPCNQTEATLPSNVDMMDFSVPRVPNLLIAYSTVPGYYSLRNPITGSHFVRYLCDFLGQLPSKCREMKTLITDVSRQMAENFESDLENKAKQMPYLVSTLSQGIKFIE